MQDPVEILTITENVKTTEAITENVTLDSLTVTGVNPLQENLGLTAKDQTYDVIKRSLGSMPHMAAAQETDISIAEYLARPLLIASIDMTTGGTVTPWSTFLTNPAVAAKIRNVYLIRGNMHLRFIPQADAYTYGMATVIPTIHGKLCDAFASDYGALIDVGTQKEVELVTPYFAPTPFIVVPAAASATQFSYRIDAFVGPRSSQTSVIPPVSISVYAWITEPDMRIPYAQSGIMKGVNWVNENVPQEAKPAGLLSKPMSAINRAANELSEVPIIGSIAKTAGAIAGAIGRVASWFGFSRPAYLIDAINNIKRYGTNTAAGFGPTYSLKVDHDPKRSKSVDPSTIIGMGHDQLAFGYITRHWGYITTVGFANTAVVGTSIFSAYCAPGAVRTSGARVYHTPLSSVSSLFKYWAGTLEYKFVVVCSTFHKGRVRIYWNPTVATENPTNTTTMLTMDIAPGNTATMVVPWGSDRPYRQGGIQSYIPGGLSGLNNGYIYAEIDQKVQVPDVSALVYVMVFVRAGTDMKFAVPSGTNYIASKVNAMPGVAPTRAEPYVAVTDAFVTGEYAFPVVNQGKVDGYGLGVTNKDTADKVDPELALEIFGDDCVTLRTLMKRYDLYASMDITGGAAFTSISYRRLPDTVEIVGGAQKNNFLTLLEYVGRSFILNSGSTRVMVETAGSYGDIRICRSTGTNCLVATTSAITPVAYTRTYVTAERQFNGSTATRLESTGPFLEFEIPDCSGLRAQINTFDPTVEDTTIVADIFSVTNVAANGTSSLRVSYAAGEDFNFYGYCGPPSMYYWNPIM